MEEKNGIKTVELKHTAKKDEHQKLSYEQLNDACNQLFQQNQRLVKRNNELEQFLLNKRLEYLFKVISIEEGISNKMFSKEFITACAKEIEEALTVTRSMETSKNSD